MKRAQGRSINATTNALNKSVRNAEKLQFNIKIIPEIFRNIALKGCYDKHDIATIGMCLSKKFGSENGQCFQVVDDLNDLKKQLSQFKHSKMFVIYRKYDNHWVTFCIKKLNSKIIVLYKDTFGENIPGEVENVITKMFAENVVEFQCHANKEQRDKSSSAAMSLKNMVILLRENHNDKFEDIEFCKQDEVGQIKNEFIEILRVELLNYLTVDLIKDKEYEKFKELLRDLFDICIKYAGSYESLREYIDLSIAEAELYENNPNYTPDTAREKAINSARKKFFDASHTRTILSEQRNILEKGQSVDYKIEVAKLFPAQMNKFLDLLSYVNMGHNCEQELQEIGKKLNIDLNKVIQVFDILKQATSKRRPIKCSVKVPKTFEEINADRVEETVKQTPANVKYLEQLLSEIRLGMDGEYSWNCSNTEDEELSDLSPEEVKEYYRQKYNGNEIILKLESDYYKVKELDLQWKNRNARQVYNWALHRKGNLTSNDLFETIAVMNRANELVTGGYQLRDTQILTALLFGQSKKNRGQLYQIHTGEGKTITVSLIATLQVLRGRHVDVITSNPVLAREGVQSREHFYGMFNISTSDNNPEQEIQKVGPRECYTADIVYGTMANFQFDYLKDLFERFYVRASRKFDFAILDEVDSMTIDQGSYIAKLAAPFPSMDLLKYVYLKIWQELCKAEESSLVDIDLKLEQKASELLTSQLTDPQKKEDYENYTLQICNGATDEIKNRIKESRPTDIELIPVHLQQYAEDMLDRWIDNALYAKYECHINEHYVIKKKNGEDVIVPVDYQNTGVTLKNTIWSNGLHQFIQLKHNLQVTTESLTSSSISNIGYIKLYNNNIVGVTGTLGSVAEQRLLSEIYNINYIKIPTYKEKNFRELNGIVIADEQWANAVALVALLVANEGRSMLIISKTIKDLEELTNNIKGLKEIEGLGNIKIKTYPDEDGSKIVNEEVNTHEIIVATNIAGRGTDFKTSLELEENGGLHVCVTFLPVNQRVEDQAFGRTSRQGNCGTSQLIIKSSDVEQLDIQIVPDMDFLVVKRKRDEMEKLRLENIRNEKLIEIGFQDSMVNSFASFYKTFKDAHSSTSAGLFLAEDLKEFWAFWLQKQKFEGKLLTEDKVAEEFGNFKRDAKSILGGKITQNPYYSIRYAENLLIDNQVEEAEKALYHAIALCRGKGEDLHPAYIKLFEVAIEKGEQLKKRLKTAFKKAIFLDIFSDIKSDHGYKIRAKEALFKALRALEKEINYIQKHIMGEDIAVANNQTALGITEKNDTTEASTNLISLPSLTGTSDITNQQIKEYSNKDFSNIVIKEKDNLLVKHIISRYTALVTFRNNVQGLLKQLEESSEKSTEGVAIGGRMSNYLQKLDPNRETENTLKEHLTKAEMLELELIGLDIMYTLKNVHDVPDQVILGARCQIGGGLAALGIGVGFPISMPVMGQIAGAMISEGIVDIVMELCSRGDSSFNKAAFIKGKCISYGMTVATMGLNAILTCTKILEQTIKACKSLSTMLKQCPYFTTLCKKLATQIDRLCVYFEELKNAAVLYRLSQVRLSRACLFTNTLKYVGKVSIQNVVCLLTIQKLITKVLEKILENILPYIQKEVLLVVNNTIREEQLKYAKIKDVKHLICEIITGTYGEIAIDVLKEVSLALLRHSASWKAKSTHYTLCYNRSLLVGRLQHFTFNRLYLSLVNPNFSYKEQIACFGQTKTFLERQSAWI